MANNVFSHLVVGKYKDASEAFIDLRLYYNEINNQASLVNKKDFIIFKCEKYVNPYDLASEKLEIIKNDDYAYCIELERSFLKKIKEERGYKRQKGIKAFLFFGYY